MSCRSVLTVNRLGSISAWTVAPVVHSGSADGKPETGHIDADLGNGTKVVEICFPWSRAVTISGFTLDDGAAVVPVRRKYTMISYGDSITHGYDAEHPSLALSSALARMLDADNTNKAIAGDIFFPELLIPEEPITPDIVTAAYGTNNWNIQDKESVCQGLPAILFRPVGKIPVIADLRGAPDMEGRQR